MRNKKIELMNAKYMNEQYPDTFYVPSDSELDNLKVGDIVKVCVNRERFWVEIICFDDKKISTRIDNQLIFTDEHGLSLNDHLVINKENILDIYGSNN
jgi:hypothetical protein